MQTDMDNINNGWDSTKRAKMLDSAYWHYI